MQKKLILLLLAANFYFHAKAQSIEDVQKYMAKEQYSKAKSTLFSILEKSPTSADVLYAAGDFYIKMYSLDSTQTEFLDSAAYYFDKGLGADAKNALNLCGKGTVAYLRKNWGESANYFEQAIKNTKGKNAKVLYSIARTYMYKGAKDINIAIAHLEKATTLEPKNTDIILALGDAYLIKEPGNGTNAIKQYNIALKINPKLAEAHTKVGVTYKLAKSYSQALSFMEEAIKADPDYAPAYRERAELFFKLKDYRDRAADEYRKYLQMSDGSYKAKFRFALFLFTNKEYEEALAQLNELKKQNPKDRYLYRLAAYSNYELGFAAKDTIVAQSYYQQSYDDLTTFFELVTDTNKIIPSDNIYYGKLLLKVKSDTSGIRYIAKGIANDTASNYEVFNELAQYFKAKKKYLKSALFFEEYYKYKKPGLADLVNNLGLQYYNAKDFVRADSAFARVIAYKPDDIIGYKWRAKSNYNIDPDGKLGTGVPYCQKYLELAIAKNDPKLKPDMIDAYKYLAKVAIMAKDNATAKENLKKVLELDPNDADAKMVLSKLK